MNRRGLLKALGAAGLAPVMAPVASAAALSGQTSALGLAGAAASYMYGGPPSVGLGGPLDLVNKVAQLAYQKYQRDLDRKYRSRIGGLDHDIWALASLPLSTKLRMQRERDAADRSVMVRLGKAAGFEMEWAE